MDEQVVNSAGKELIDATQEAVMDAVADVENIIKTTTEEIAGSHHEVFYQSAEFWVGVAFCIVVAGLFVPIKRLLTMLLQKRIDNVVNQIEDAEKLRDEARELLASYEQKMENIEEISSSMAEKTKADIDVFCNNQKKVLDKDLAVQERNAELNMNALKEKIASESSALLADCVAKTLDRAIRENLDEKQQSKMIDGAIAAIESL
ncbi:MAG: hypothetical protein J6Y53_00465 [Alphaproteobacteria bacterium]|nr:hypothetical protein [Alphaproteobacteria bacterium]